MKLSSIFYFVASRNCGFILLVYRCDTLIFANDSGNLYIDYSQPPSTPAPKSTPTLRTKWSRRRQFFFCSLVLIMAAAKAAPLIWINGFPGSGKLTIAKAVAKLHGKVILLDNHKLIDPVEAKLSRSHPDYQKQRKLQRQMVFDQYVCDPTTFSDMVICTGEGDILIYTGYCTPVFYISCSCNF